jgi:ubiquinone/menaquinone biosynthesis C-methylase UbiE
MAHTLSKEGYLLTGIDISQNATDTAKKNAPEATFLKVDVDNDKLPFADDEFDGVVCLEVLEHLKNLDKLMSELFRVLKKGGKFCVSVPIGHNHNCLEHLRFFDFYKTEETFHDYTSKFKIMRIYKTKLSDNERTLWGIVGEKE